MNQKTLNCKYIYDSITENENVYTLQKKIILHKQLMVMNYN